MLALYGLADDVTETLREHGHTLQAHGRMLERILDFLTDRTA